MEPKGSLQQLQQPKQPENRATSTYASALAGYSSSSSVAVETASEPFQVTFHLAEENNGLQFLQWQK
jgi:hypothetical protein